MVVKSQVVEETPPPAPVSTHAPEPSAKKTTNMNVANLVIINKPVSVVKKPEPVGISKPSYKTSSYMEAMKQ